MEAKLAVLCVLVSLLSLVSLSHSEDLDLNVKVVTSIANIDENFICATLDWWPSNKCDYGQCPWERAGIFNLVINLCLYIRVFHISLSRIFRFSM